MKMKMTKNKISQRSLRNKARNLLKPSLGMEFDNIIPLSKRGSTSIKEWGVVSRKTNRKKGSRRK